MFSVLSEARRVNEIINNYELPSGEDDCIIKIDEISEIRERLIDRGFAKSFLPKGFSLPEDASAQEIRDVQRQIKEMRYADYLKKSTLRRLDHAMASYRIAHLHFKSGALSNAYRNLPYDGNVLGRVARFGATAARLYFEIKELLSGQLEQLGISIEVAVPSEQGVKYERVQLYGVKNVDDYIANMYGRDAEVVRTKIITRHRSMLSSVAYRRVLACAYATSAFAGKNVSLPKTESKKLMQYMQILEKYGIQEPVRTDVMPEARPELLDQLEKGGLLSWANGKAVLDEELSAALNEASARRHWEYAKDAYAKMSTDIIRLVMLTSKSTRRSMGVFSFDDDFSLIWPVAEKAGLAGLARAYEMMAKKCEIEEALGFADRDIGPAVFAYYQGPEKLRELFGRSIKDLGNDYEVVRAYIEGRGGKGEEFLEHLKK
ncbi:MAG: hypothetical protein QXU54_02540 [Candidatus Micrarchaeia archaeon]